MAKLVKCKICGEKIDKSTAFCHIHVTSGGKEQKQYYCSKEEYEFMLEEKEYYKLCQYSTDDILGHPICNNARNKKLTELHDNGFMYKEIFQCIESMSEEIKGLFELNEITVEYHQIAYMFACIGNRIYDFVLEQKHKEEWNKTLLEQRLEDNSEGQEMIEEEYRPTDFKIKRKGLF